MRHLRHLDQPCAVPRRHAAECRQQGRLLLILEAGRILRRPAADYGGHDLVHVLCGQLVLIYLGNILAVQLPVVFDGPVEHCHSGL